MINTQGIVHNLLTPLVIAVAGLSATFVPQVSAAQDAVAVSVEEGNSATGVSAEDLRRIWADPTFQKQFVGGYGVNAEIEPRVTKEEVAILEKVRPLMADDLALAESALRKLMKPDCSAILDFTLGGLLFQQDKLPEALTSFREAVRKFPTFRRAYRNIGLIAVRNSDFDGAIAAFNKMIELGGADAYSYGLLAFSHASKQDYQPAEAAYRNALLLQPTNVEWRLGLTRCVFKQGKYQDAAALLDVLITQFPEKVDFWMLLAYTYVGMKEPMKAAATLESVDALGKSTLEGLGTLGDIYLNENLPSLAYGAYERSIKQFPQQALAKPLRSAEVLAARGGGPEAKKLVALVQETWKDRLEDADKARVLKLQARLAMADGGGDESTAAVLEEIVRIDPLDGEALMLLGQHYARAGQPDKAMLVYERAAGIEKHAPNAKVRQAQILVSQSRYADALQLLRQAQEIKPREDVARYLEQIDRLSKSRK
jgi:tetratricopeptide (TPR) repeat protein